jgi:hypothetical protein
MRGLTTISTALGRSLVRLMTHRVRFCRDVGQPLTMEDGMQFTVFRHVTIKGPGTPAAAFIVRFTPAHMSVRQNMRFSRLPMIPLLGMRGFREKYWCVNEKTGMCQGIYAWQTLADAEAYASSVALRFMTGRSMTGSVSHRIIDQSCTPYWIFASSFASTPSALGSSTPRASRDRRDDGGGRRRVHRKRSRVHA